MKCRTICLCPPFVSVYEFYHSRKKERVRRKALNKYYELQRSAVSYLPVNYQDEIFTYL